MINFKKVLALLLATTSLYSGAVNAAEGEEQKVLVLGANQLDDKSWNESFAEDGNVWAEHLYNSRIDLTTVSSVGESYCSEIFGDHIGLNWNNAQQLQSQLVANYYGSFDLITNDYCVAYFIHDKTLPPILRTLRVGGKFVYGPLKANAYNLVNTNRLLPQSVIDLVKEPGDISFYRNGLGILTPEHITKFDITMVEKDDQQKAIYHERINDWQSHSLSHEVVAIKNLMRGFVNESFERMTLDNFAVFINVNCGFDVDVELIKSENPEIQNIFENILPAGHPGADCREGDWVVMTRIN